MLRKTTEDDFLDLIAFRCAAYGCTRTEAAHWIRDIVGFENILVLEKPDDAGQDKLAAMLAAVPVRADYHHGIWVSGFATEKKLRGKGLMTKLLETFMRAYAENGCDFAVTTPDTPDMERWLEKHQFKSAFPQRTLTRPIPRNLVAQASFDTMTVSHLLEARLNYQPGCILLPEERMQKIIMYLYSNGITLVSSPYGYGLYYQKENLLQFVELQADNDRAAELLMQAAREKTGAEQAQIMLAEGQTLFQGEGKRTSYGLIRFLKQPFPLEDMYFRLLI